MRATGLGLVVVVARAPQGVETAVLLPLQLAEDLQTARVGQVQVLRTGVHTGGVDLTAATTTFEL